jgi:hypothetical protein
MEVIQRVWVNKTNGQKCVTIPKDAKIFGGDYVRIKKVQVDD